MPKLWLPNAEDVFFGLNSYPISHQIGKYIWSINRNDIFISPVPLEKSLLEYIGKIKRFNRVCKTIILKKFSTPYSIVESILQNSELLNQLNQLTQKGNWQLEAFIQSKPAVKLSEELGIPIKGTPKNLILDGLTEELNCKSEFKNLCEQIGIDTVPGYIANNLEELLKAIDQVSHENDDKIILKKSKSLGGRGNRVGNKNSLKQNLEKWYVEKEKVLIEYFLDFEVKIGALSAAKDQKVDFLGIDEQIIKNCRWKGFWYPLKNKLNNLIKEKTLAFSNLVQKKGARGFISIDYGICNGKLYGMECNFRHTGFSFLFDTFIKGHEDKRNVFYHTELLFPNKIDFLSLKTQLQKISYNRQPVLIQKPEQNEGLVIINITPTENTYGAVIYSDDEDYVKEVLKLIS